MSLEGDPAKGKSSKTRDLLKAATFGAAVLGAGGVGIEAGTKNAVEQVDRHLLTPTAIQELQQETGATSKDIKQLEENLRLLMIQELKRQLRRET